MYPVVLQVSRSEICIVGGSEQGQIHGLLDVGAHSKLENTSASLELKMGKYQPTVLQIASPLRQAVLATHHLENRNKKSSIIVVNDAARCILEFSRDTSVYKVVADI